MKKLLFIVAQILGISLLCLAQQANIDILSQQLKTSSEDTNKVNTLNKLSELVGWRVGNYDTVFVLANQALSLAKKLNYERGESDSYSHLGIAYYSMNEYSKAMDCYQKSLELRIKIVEKKGVANCYNNIGNIYLKQKNYKKTLECYEKSLQIRNEIKDKQGAGMNCFNIGLLYFNIGDIQKSLDYYKKSLGIREEIIDKKGIANCYLAIGKLYYEQENYSISKENYYKALKVYEELADKRNLVECYQAIAAIYSNQRDYIRGIEIANKAAILSEEIGGKNKAAYIYINIGGDFGEQNNSQKSIEFFLRAAKIFEDTNDKYGLGVCYSNLAVTLLKSNSQQSEEYFSKSFKIAKEINDDVLIEKYYQGIGDIYFAKKNYSSALKEYSKSYNVRKNITNLETRFVKTYTLNHQLDSAAFYLSLLLQATNKSINTNYYALSEQEKERYFSRQEREYNLYQEFAVLTSQQFPFLIDTAFNLTLINKGLTLKSSTAMRATILKSKDSSLITKYENWLSLKKQLAKAYDGDKDVKELESEASDVERELVKSTNLFSDFNKIKNLNWRQVQMGLKKGEAAIEFVHFNSQLDTTEDVKYYAMLVKRGSVHPEIISLCTEEELKLILGNFQGNNLGFVNKVYGTKLEAQTMLYKKIWEPIEKYLTDIKTIYYSPSGLLHKVSFAALCIDKNSYLCGKFKLNQQSSTGKLVSQNNAVLEKQDFITLMGGVKYSNNETKNEIWSYLPGTLNETQSIDKLLNNKNIQHNYFFADNASEANFKTNSVNATIIHTSTHGFFYPNPLQLKEEVSKAIDTSEVKTPNENIAFRGGTTDYANWSFVNNRNPLMRSGIVLAGANDVWERDPMAEGEDGVLTAQEVSNMDMRKTKLVVLSACETGLGDIKGSEGVYGLQRAFKMAGVNYIIMSLWQVPDKETSEFMINFYQKLTTEKDIKRAFYETQKEMRKKYDPYYWAAFVLVE